MMHAFIQIGNQERAKGGTSSMSVCGCELMVWDLLRFTSCFLLLTCYIILKENKRQKTKERKKKSSFQALTKSLLHGHHNSTVDF